MGTGILAIRTLVNQAVERWGRKVRRASRATQDLKAFKARLDRRVQKATQAIPALLVRKVTRAQPAPPDRKGTLAM